MRQIFIAAGNKGGVGKTSTAAIAVDFYLARGRRVAVVETDLTQPDVRNRYTGAPGILMGELDLGGDAEGAVVRLGTWIESKSAGVDAIVINSPAGGGAVLDPFASILQEVAFALDFGLIVTWVIGATIEDTESVRRSLYAGLLSLPSATRTVCLAGWMGDPRTWPWTRSAARAEALAAGVGEKVVPALTQAVMSQVIQHNTTSIDTLSWSRKIGQGDKLFSLTRRMVFYGQGNPQTIHG